MIANIIEHRVVDSTSEVATDEHWIDGKRVFQRIFEFTLGTIPSGSTEVYTGFTTGVFDTDTIISSDFTIAYTNANDNLHYSTTLPARKFEGWAARENSNNQFQMSIHCYHKDANYNGATVYAIIRYTKL